MTAPYLSDPTYQFCRVRNTFTSENPDISVLKELVAAPRFHHDFTGRPRLIDPRKAKTDDVHNVDVSLYSRVNSLKNKLDFPGYSQIRSQTNPFEKLGTGQFINRAGLKLANIDAVFNLTGSADDYSKPRDLGSEGVFLDLAGGPGGFVQYMQYRVPKWKGIGITKKDLIDYQMESLNPKNFRAYYGADESGDLYKQYPSVINEISTTAGTVHLVLADGGFDVSDGKYEQQEFLSSHLILIEAYLAVTLTRLAEDDNPGGDLVLKLFETVTTFSEQLIAILATCYEKVYLFKPVTSRPANSEKYLIGINLVQRNNKLLKQMLTRVNPHQYPSTFFTSPSDDPHYEQYLQWLKQHNNLFLMRQQYFLHRILAVYQKTTIEDIPVDLHAAYLRWNMPVPELKF